MENVKKYEFTGETKIVFGRTLHRIRALISFETVGVGDLGGWIEKESNLSHDGNAWVYYNAKVYDDAKVSGNARVSGNAKVYDDAKVYGNAQVYDDAKVSGNAWVYGNAKVYDDAKVSGNARVSGNAKVYDDAKVSGNAKVYDDAKVSGNAWVYGDAKVSGNAWVYDDARVSKLSHLLVVGRIGSRFDFTTFYRNKGCNKDCGIHVKCGCFNGSIEDFEQKVKETHGDNKHGKVYSLAIQLAKEQIDLT